MSVQDRRTINRYLGNRGLATLEDPRGLVAQLGFLVEDEKHFLQILNKCEPSERRNLYESLRPHLSFTPRPLDVLISELGQQAEREQLPTVDEEGKFHAYRTPEIRTDGLWTRDEDKLADKLTDTIADTVEATIAAKHLTVTCRSCTKEETFHGGTRADVLYKLRAAGWTWGVDPSGEGKEICPTCPASRN